MCEKNISGHDLVREIIVKHGVNRYPTWPVALLKIMEELGELTQALLKSKDPQDIAKEYGDVGLVLHGLGNILELNLDKCMADVVKNETRSFV